MAEHRFKPSTYYYCFGTFEPALRVRSGDTIVAETLDARGDDKHGQPLVDSKKQRIEGTTLIPSNPCVGPIYIDEAEEGDTLAVHIQRIQLNRDYAYSKQSSNFGSLTGEKPGHKLLYNDPVVTHFTRWQLDLGRNIGSLELPKSRLKQVEVPLTPFIGSIGVAPRFGRIETTLTPGEFGGNMDCVETRQGTVLYLPVWTRGAYLFFGDIHALQGDGEVNGTALETTAEVALKIDVVKGNRADWPRLENETHIMVVGSTRPLMDCVRLAQIGLLDWLIESYGFQREEAWQLMGQVATMRIGNVVDPSYTVVAKFPKKYLP